MDKDSLKTKKERFTVLQSYWADNFKIALAAMKFAAGDQWPEEMKRKREQENRPCLTVDKSGQYIRQVVNDSRQNRPSIKVRPIDDAGDVEIAEALQGLVRHITDRSNADDAYDCAIENAVKSGFGWVRVITEYAHGKTFNQEIRIERVPNVLSVLMGPHLKADGSDAADCFITTDMPKAEFKRRWPKAKETNWESDCYSGGWVAEETVRVCEHFYKEEKNENHLLLIDGTVVTETDYWASVEQGAEQIPVVESRQLPTTKVMWCRMTGGEILEESEWLGKYLPIVPCYGNESNIEGKTLYTGLITSAIDAMMLYNFSRTAVAEGLGLSNKVPYIGAAEATEGFEDEWAAANSSNAALIHFNAYDSNGNPLPRPERQAGVVASDGFLRDMQVSEHDIQAAMGMYNASLGEKSNEKSGKAIMARQREGDTATFHFQDNLNRAVRMVGVICVDLVPKVYDSKRLVRLVGEDGDATDAQIDPNQQQPVVKQGGMSIYNLNIGQYDVNISAGASYTTRRVEQAEAMMAMVQSAPEIMQIAGDLLIKSQDWPNADDLAERFKMMLPPQIQQSLQKNDEASPEMQQAQQYVDQAMQQVEQAQQQIQEAGQQLQQEQQTVGAEKASLEAERAKLEAAKRELDSASKVLTSRYQELSAKIKLEAMQAAATVPQNMPPGETEPAIDPYQPADAGFFTTEELQ